MCDQDFGSAKSLLADRLRALDPTGPAGFEGLMRDALTEITGQLFRLAKSGPQGGTDVRSVGANTVRIGLEGKRYGATTTLGFDELQAKLVDAAHQNDPIDLWLLAATRELDAGDIERLERIGKQHGVTAVVLDWPPYPGILPDLAMICVEAPQTVKQHLGRDIALVEAVRVLAAHPEASSIRERLRRQFLSPDIGYVAAANAMQAWMRSALASESNAAARLGSGFNNLAQTGTKCISRASVNAALDQWLAGRRTTVLLGDEGVGKTWSFLSWWLTRLEEPRALPLTLFVSAKEVRDDDVEILVSRLLEKRLDHGDAHFWQRRINQWRRAPIASPQFMLIIDGLNENWSRNDWAEFLQPLYDEKWAGRFAILLTCWPDHWNRLRSLAPLVPKSDEINVNLFDDRELDELLSLHGLHRSHFSREMLDLMKVPRLSALAIERRADLATSGDITPERLAYEDWKHRLRRRGARLAVDDDEFQDFVVECGRALKTSLDGANFSRAELIDRLGRNSGAAPEGLRETVSELIAGRWLERGSRSNQFRVHMNLVPFALGMTLARELKDRSAGHSAEEIISSFLDPYRGQRLGVAILRSAITAALLDNAVGREDRAAILRRWINERNFAHIDFETFPRLLGLDAELFFQTAEFHWLSLEGRSSFTDELLIKGLANAFDYPQVATRLKDRVTKWLGWVWTTGDAISMQPVSGELTSENRAPIPHSLACWHNAAVASEFPRIDFGPEGDVGSLAKSALGVISFLPRPDFIQALVAWALSRSVMGRPHDIDELSWVVRISENDHPRFRPALDVEIERLCDTRNPIALIGARWLLQAQGSPSAEARLATLDDEAVGQDGQGHGAAASIETVLKTHDRDAVSAASLATHIFNGRELWLHSRQKTATDYDFEYGRVGLARSDPNRLREILGEAAMSTVERNPSELDGLVLRLPTFQLVLTPAEQATVAASIERALLDESVLQSQDQLDWWGGRKLGLCIWGQPAESQLRLLIDSGMHLKAVNELLPILESPEPDALRAALGRFPANGAQDVILGWLRYLATKGSAEALKGWAGVVELVTSPVDTIRTAALEIAFMTRERSTLEAIASDGRRLRDANTLEERGHGSLALWAASEVLERPDLLARADPELAAPRLRRSPEDAEALCDYSRFVQTTLDSLYLKIGRSFPSHWARHDEAMETLVTKSSTFVDWLGHWLSNDQELAHFALMERFPLEILCDVLMKAEPEVGLDLWHKLNSLSDSGIFKSTSLSFLPFEAPTGTVGDLGRHEALLRVTTDKELLALAVAAHRGGHEDWLEAQIRQDEASGESGRIARSYSLLGFADDRNNLGDLWHELGGRKPLYGWLANVFDSARATFQRNRSAREFYDSYLAADSPVAALSAYDLFVSSVDARAVLWIKQQDIRVLKTGFRSHWNSNLEGLNIAIRERSDALKETLFFTKTVRNFLWPWL